jgi:hypothetical protein
MRISTAVQFLIDKKYLDIVVREMATVKENKRRVAIIEWLSDLDTGWELGSNLSQHAKTVENYIKKVGCNGLK